MSYVEETTSLVDRQIRLEEEALGLGILRYRKNQERVTEAETAPGKRLVTQAIEALSAAIAAWVSNANTGKAGRRHAALKWVEPFEPDVLAYLTSIACVSALSAADARAQAVAATIATSMADEINYGCFKRGAPGLYHVIQKAITKSTSGRHSRAVMNHAMDTANVQRIEIPVAEGLRAGLVLIDLFIEATGLASLTTERAGTPRERLLFRGTPAIIEWLEAAHEAASKFLPVHLPMLVPPKPWTGGTDGGYLTDASGRNPLVRTRNKAFLRELDNADMPAVYEALNAIQETAWSVNTAVLAVMRAAWDGGGGIGGLPTRDLSPLPDRPVGLERDGEAWKEAHPDEFKAWKRSRAAVYEENARAVSKRVAAAHKLWIAEKFASEAAIYFPHSLDFRGRAYPMPALLNPQGDDAAKALLRFSKGVPLGKDGGWWLAVHVANLFGVDKVSLLDRVRWVRENEEAILDSALNPLDGARFWTQADSPWCALAACFEYAGYLVAGDDYVSHLPIAFDGSCNGLQNFSAMRRDPIGGAATNLVPSPKPADIYTRVMDVAAVRVRAEAEAGNPNAIFWDGRLNRSMVKRPVMTLPYGVTKPGMRDQILGEMKKQGIGDSWDASEYLAAVLWDCIGQVVIAAREAMDWLRGAAKVASKGDLPIRWTTPAGFPVLQDYRETSAKKLTIHIDGRARQLLVTKDGDKLDRRRQALGISPNFVHSCDASHMMLTVVLARANGIDDFAMIHDSYGTHAGNAGILAAALRQAFVDQYTGDVLGAFRDELVEQLPLELAAELPPLPFSGDLDLTNVLVSQYFFA